MARTVQIDVPLDSMGLLAPSYVVIVHKLIVIMFSDVHQVYF